MQIKWGIIRVKSFIVSFILVLTTLISFQLSSSSTFAQNEHLFGQNHFYTVVFRGNGEAVVYSKIVLTNSNDTTFSQLSFEVPRVTPSEVAIFQQKLSPQCVQYDYQKPEKPCLKYREPDYNSYYSYYYGYGDSRAEYQKVQFTQTGSLYQLTLPYPVEPYKSTAVIISYAAKGYVKENFGLYKFNFETLKVPTRINEVKVAVDVDSDLVLKGKRSQVNYKSSKFAMPSLDAPAAITSPSLDKIVGSIGSYGPLVKDAKNLAPNESFSVKGEYATNWLRLYLSSIVIVIFVVVAIFAGIYFLTKFLEKREKKNTNTETVNNSQIASMQPEAGQSLMRLFYTLNILMGFISVLLVVALTFILRFLSESDLFRSFQYGPDPIIIVVTIISVLLLYILAIFGPAIFAASKKGWKALLFVLVSEFLWFLVILILYLVLF